MDQSKEKKHGVVQTYAEDMAKVIENDKNGLVKKIIHGEEEHEKEKMNLSPQSKKNQFFMLAGLLFAVLGVATLFYFFSQTESPEVAVEQQFSPLIFLDASVYVEIAELNKDQIVQTVLGKVRGTQTKPAGVEGIYLTDNKKIIGLRKFISSIKGNFAPDENPLLVSDNFLMGVVNREAGLGVGGDFFILLKMRSTSDIFDSLRLWENKMFSDLHGFFGLEVSSETRNLLTANFEDGIFNNKNARILYQEDEQGGKQIVMMYIFANDNSVIITRTERAAQEIMLRLSSSQIKK